MPWLRACISRVWAGSAPIGLAVALACAAAPVAAHEEMAGRLFIEHPWVTPAKAGATAWLYMRIVNEGRSGVHLLGVVTPAAERSGIMFRSGPGSVSTLASVLIEPEGSLGLHTSHMWIELSGLKRDLRSGDSFPATLEFSDGRRADVVVVVGEATHPPGTVNADQPVVQPRPDRDSPQHRTRRNP